MQKQIEGLVQQIAKQRDQIEVLEAEKLAANMTVAEVLQANVRIKSQMILIENANKRGDAALTACQEQLKAAQATITQLSNPTPDPATNTIEAEATTVQ